MKETVNIALSLLLIAIMLHLQNYITASVLIGVLLITYYKDIKQLIKWLLNKVGV